MANILAVDDSVSMRQMIVSALKGAGHEVTEAGDGVEAISRANENKFDLVVTDINMPNMDGIQLTEKLRTMDSFKFTPILMLTTESAADKKQAGKQAGATGWIVKPFEPEKFLEIVGKVLG